MLKYAFLRQCTYTVAKASILHGLDVRKDGNLTECQQQQQQQTADGRSDNSVNVV